MSQQLETKLLSKLRRDSKNFLYGKVVRMEKSKNIPLLLSHIKLNHLELFTHEWAINDEVKTKIQETCDYLGKQGYVWSFPEDHFS